MKSSCVNCIFACATRYRPDRRRRQRGEALLASSVPRIGAPALLPHEGTLAVSHKLPVSVLVIIHSPEGKVLLIERADHPGFWQSVTGSIEASDASLAHTAAREVEEETGIQALPAQFCDWGLSNSYDIYPVWRHRYAPGVTRNTEHVFSLCVPVHTLVRLSPREHTAWQWLAWQAAAEQCFSPSNAEAILLLPRFVQGAADLQHPSATGGRVPPA
jgi:dATP pyrophosphohydrolase